MSVSFGKAAYAKVIQRLIERIYHQSPLQDSIYEQAIKSGKQNKKTNIIQNNIYN